MLNENIILGIDPGLTKTGWGVIFKNGPDIRYVDCGVIRTNALNSMETRLNYIFDEISSLLAMHKPDVVAMEEVFVNKNFKSSEKLIMARTSAFLAVAKHGLEVGQYSPNEVKKNVTGLGHASKDQVYNFVRKILKIDVLNDKKLHTLDSFDALAIALSQAFCHKSAT